MLLCGAREGARLLKARADARRRMTEPERNEVEASTGAQRARGQVVGARRLRRAVMSPEALLALQA
jgi:hypothetical protein